MEDVDLVLRNMGVKRWRTRTLDRAEWAFGSKEATVKLQEEEKEKQEE
jgi:hypothetical protein